MPAIEAEYGKFLERVEEENDDPEWAIENHPARKILEHYTPEFKAWLAWLYRVRLMQRGGYPFAVDDLTATDWQALAIIENHSVNREGVKLRDKE